LPREVLVGVGQVVHRTGEPGLPGPVELATESLRRAGADSRTGDRLLRSADLIAAATSVSRPYSDLGALTADGPDDQNSARRILIRATDTDTIAAFADGDPLGMHADITAADKLTLLTERTVR
jgi:hypothetical protein